MCKLDELRGPRLDDLVTGNSMVARMELSRKMDALFESVANVVGRCTDEVNDIKKQVAYLEIENRELKNRVEVLEQLEDAREGPIF